MTTQFRNVLALALFPLLSTFSTASMAWSVMDCCECFELSPYIGYDAQLRNIEMPSNIDPGGKLFKKEYPSNNLYAGLKFCDYVGLEAGYSASATRTKYGTVVSGEQVFNIPTTFTPDIFVSKAKYRGWNASLVGFLPFCISSVPFDILGSIGMTRLSTYHQSTLLGDSISSLNYFTNGYTFKRTKSILKLGIGGQFTICDAYGIRFKVDWENTSRINANIQESRPGLGNATLKLKNSQIYSLGAFFFFF